MGTINLRTPIPGPISQRLMGRRNEAVARGVSSATPVFVASAEGAVIEDVDGNRFIDFAGGIGCLNAGHRAPGVLSAIRAQLDRYLHVCFSVTPYEGYVRLAERLNRLTPGTFPKKTFLTNSGAEAVENAVKFARAYTGRQSIICFEDAFHGRTLLTMSLTSKTHPYKAGFGPFAAEIYRIPYAYCYRCAYSLTYPTCGVFCAHHLEDTFRRMVAAESVAAVIMEPVLGEGGFVAPPPEFFPVLAEICRRHGIVFIADEIQTGFGRTGALFASERYGIEPDLMVTAKSLGGGLPIAAVTGRAEIMDAPGPGSVGGTFGGNPLACESALAVLDLFEAGSGGASLTARAEQLGDRFVERARAWQQRLPLIGDVRGLGAMRALELVRSRETREPADEETRAVVRHCYERGLIILSTGTYGNVIRLLVPLVITDEQFEEGLDVLEAALEATVDSRR
ncbi:MAG TPA: 4-aminobutyrate--2-oxoglutarate transaminase [Terriglobia bacterium]|nr:4-aminobutyrate--2-oxoglutarate transaminase [Terriglobia bacterium]